MFAYIPARGGSKRIKNKNIKLLGNEPIIKLTIRNLLNLDFIDNVFVSTDSEEIADIAKKCGAKIIELRPKNLADNTSGFMDLLKKDVNKYIERTKSNDFLFVLATAALVTPSIYKNSFSVYKKEKPEILMSCKETNPYWAMKYNKSNVLEPIFPEYVLTNSQDLPVSYIDAGLFYYINYKQMLHYDSFKKAKKIHPFLVEDIYSVDVDTREDWNRLEINYNYLKQNKSNLNLKHL